MDLVRSSYIGAMVFSPGGPPFPVRWFRAAPNALAFPYAHSFFSYDSEDEKDNDGIGERRPPRGDWYNGMRPAALIGDGHFIGTPEQFLLGVSPGDAFAGPWSVVLEPEPCVCHGIPADAPENDLDADVAWHETCGGLRWVENVANPVIPAVFDVVLTSVAGDTDDDGRFTVTYDSLTRTWTGSTFFDCLAGHAFVVTCTVVRFSGDGLRVEFDAGSSLCGPPGQMYGFGAIVNGDNTNPDTIFPLIGYIPQIDDPTVVQFWFDGIVT